MKAVILLFGARGQLGTELARSLPLLAPVVEADQAECDLCDPARLQDFVRTVRPTLIVNAAAYTAVDKAETERALAEQINAVAPGVMAEEARRLGAAMVHYSTDYVYPGDGTEPVVEDQAPAPLSVYGATKLAGDRALQAAGCPHLILRTTWVYGQHGGNFVKTILRLAASRDELRIVADQFGAPTWSRMLAAATTLAISRLGPTGRSDAWSADGGLYHLSAGGRTNWLEFAREIVATGVARGLLPARERTLVPVTTEAYGAPARRPRNSVLSNARFRERFGISLPDWRASFRQMIEEATRHFPD